MAEYSQSQTQTAARTVAATVVWGRDVEQNDFVKVPRALLKLGAYSTRMGREIQPRHILMLLNLASRRFRDQPLTVEWKNLARDLGVTIDTVRHWAYELRDLKLIKINGLFLGEGSTRKRARGVEIDLSGFVKVVKDAYEERRIERQNRLADDDLPF